MELKVNWVIGIT